MNGQRLSADRIAPLLDQMKGLTVALATTLNEFDEWDAARLERLLERVIAGGESCLFPLGWMGEQPLLSSSARNAMLVETCRIAKGRLPVMVGENEHRPCRGRCSRRKCPDKLAPTSFCPHHLTVTTFLRILSTITSRNLPPPVRCLWSCTRTTR